VIKLAHRGRVWSGRRTWRKRAEAAGVRTEENWNDLARYWRILEENLAARHDATPTHSLAEIEYLHEQFPTEVILLTAKLGGTLVAGNLFFIEGPVLQARYTATTSEGRKVSATDLVIEHGIALAGARGCQFYSMGTSTLDGGRQLNGSQYAFKVSFGGGGVIHETCELDLGRVLDSPQVPG
jgi:lipid II:glycine glycyltransferase (peptidoglycan interpeptide bridge formation enzyme)